MKIGPDTAPVSAICTSNPHQIVVRGHDLVEELIGAVSFTEHAWLLIAGSLPSEAQRRVFDGALVAIAEHGLVPSVQVSRMTLAAAPEAFQGAVAAGLLGCGSVILGAAEAAGQLFDDITQEQDASGAASEAAAATIVQRYKSDKRAIPGYGHPLHKGLDPRAHKLIALLRQAGLEGRHTKAALAVETVLPAILKKPLVMNISGAIACVLLDAGFPRRALKGVPLLARTASLIAHLLEEQAHSIGFLMSHAAAKAITYSGPVPDGFIADEN